MLYCHFNFMHSLLHYYLPNHIEAGVDEAGRGCLAGPVFAAAVILPHSFCHPLLNDSKQVKEEDRYFLRKEIEKNAIAWAIAKIEAQEIDYINILQASLKAMHLAIQQLSVTPQRLLIDGNQFIPYPNIQHHCIIKGDGKYTSIAAASILAKTYRDDEMKQISKQYPLYGWHSNKGYGTILHRNALQKHGITPIHRVSFLSKIVTV